MVIFLSVLPSSITVLIDNNIQWFKKENNEVYSPSWSCASSCLGTTVQVLHHSESHLSHSLFKVTVKASTSMPPHNPTKLAAVDSKLRELEECRICSIIFQVHEEQTEAMRHDAKIKNKLEQATQEHHEIQQGAATRQKRETYQTEKSSLPGPISRKLEYRD